MARYNCPPTPSYTQIYLDLFITLGSPPPSPLSRLTPSTFRCKSTCSTRTHIDFVTYVFRSGVQNWNLDKPHGESFISGRTSRGLAVEPNKASQTEAKPVEKRGEGPMLTVIISDPAERSASCQFGPDKRAAINLLGHCGGINAEAHRYIYISARARLCRGHRATCNHVKYVVYYNSDCHGDLRSSAGAHTTACMVYTSSGEPVYLERPLHHGSPPRAIHTQRVGVIIYMMLSAFDDLTMLSFTGNVFITSQVFVYACARGTKHVVPVTCQAGQTRHDSTRRVRHEAQHAVNKVRQHPGWSARYWDKAENLITDLHRI
ncbi:hypothetical protein J6590_008478 [Homalodisca vitripennis]|nr:hypothetical protein J6590_008478 [Homalodisca vitripennis]